MGVIFSDPDETGDIPLYKVNDFWPEKLDMMLTTHSRLLYERQLVFRFDITGKLCDPPGWDYSQTGKVVSPGPVPRPVHWSTPEKDVVRCKG